MKANRCKRALLGMLSLVLAVCLCASGCLLCAFAETADNGYTYIADSGKKTAQITGYSGSSHILKM